VGRLPRVGWRTRPRFTNTVGAPMHSGRPQCPRPCTCCLPTTSARSLLSSSAAAAAAPRPASSSPTPLSTVPLRIRSFCPRAGSALFSIGPCWRPQRPNPCPSTVPPQWPTLPPPLPPRPLRALGFVLPPSPPSPSPSPWPRAPFSRQNESDLAAGDGPTEAKLSCEPHRGPHTESGRLWTREAG